MRTAKVKAAYYVLEKAGLILENKRVFDYGFGAGTFFRHLPKSASIAGVEMDEENAIAVREMVEKRGLDGSGIQAIDISKWQDHPLLDEKYDLVVCSHVLEHVPEPEPLVRRLLACLNRSGRLLVLVPINERVVNEHHVHQFHSQALAGLLENCNGVVERIAETDYFFDRLQPLYAKDASGLKRIIQQVLALGIGVLAALFSAEKWHELGVLTGKLFGFKPTQLAAVVSRRE